MVACKPNFWAAYATDRGAVVAPRRRRHASAPHRLHRQVDQIGERAACLETTRMLQQLELERERSGHVARAQTEIIRCQIDRRRTAHIAAYPVMHRRDRIARHGEAWLSRRGRR
jgi:hypothetical protein